MTGVAADERLRPRDRPRAWPLVRQRWRHLGFLHWPVDARALAAVLPPGLQVDTHDGQAFVGIVPFTIAGSRLPWTPPVPRLSSFHELNLRTYVHVGGREPGVWFFSLDAASRAAVVVGRRGYKLPYHHAAIAMTPEDVARDPGGSAALADPASRVSFSSRRLGPGAPARFTAAYAPAGPIAPARPGSLEFFLAERYLLYSWDGRRLRRARVWHHPYPLQVGRADDLDQTVTPAAGLGSVAGPPPLVHVAREVDVRIYAPRAVAV